MKMGNIVPREGIETTSLTFWSNVLPLHQVGSVMSALYPHLPVYAAPYLRGYYTHPTGIASLLMLTIICIQAMVLHIHTQGRFNNHSACSLYRILVMAPVLWMWWKWEILCLEQESDPHLWHAQPVCHHYTILMPSPYPRLFVYAAPCLRGQCRQLHN